MSRSLPASARRSRVLLVDDHPLVRERLAEVLNRETDLEVCAEAEERHQALELVNRHKPDLVVVDLTLRNSDGLELIKDIHSRWPGLRMLVVSMHDESLYAERVIRAGALGYITKQEATRSILAAVRRVLAGEVYVNEHIATQIITRLTIRPGASAKSAADLLADRELQVLELTGRGLSTRQIAEQLNIGIKTVETYRARIRAKLKLHQPGELLQHAIAWTRDQRL